MLMDRHTQNAQVVLEVDWFSRNSSTSRYWAVHSQMAVIGARHNGAYTNFWRDVCYARSVIWFNIMGRLHGNEAGCWKLGEENRVLTGVLAEVLQECWMGAEKDAV